MVVNRPEGPHYTVENCMGWEVTVTLDGKPIEGCVEANTAEGWVVIFDEAEWGRISALPTEAWPEEYPRRKLHGAVDVMVWGRQEE